MQPVPPSDSNQPAQIDYHAGLLRLWRVGAGGAWRVSLQDAESGERIGFADLDHLFAYLQRLTGDTPYERATANTTKH